MKKYLLYGAFALMMMGSAYYLTEPVLADETETIEEVKEDVVEKEETTEGQENLELEETEVISQEESNDEQDLVDYTTHVENIGWQEAVSNGETAGTTGQSLRLEGIQISLGDDIEYTGGIEYRTHIQNIGWESGWTTDGDMSGTEGQSLRLEGIQIQLYGQVADYYDVYYRVHAQNFGWLGWACNGERAGTEGFSYRLEAIEILLISKGEGTVPENTENTFVSATNTNNVSVNSQSISKDSVTVNLNESVDVIAQSEYEYWANVSEITEVTSKEGIIEVTKNKEVTDKNWTKTEKVTYSIKGLIKGTDTLTVTYANGEQKTVNVRVVNPDEIEVAYSSHIQNIGWQDEVYAGDGNYSGTSGQSLRMEAITIDISQGDIYYKSHIQNIGWESDWKTNGEISGTSGQSLRLEAIQIKLSDELAQDYDIYYRVHAENFGWLGWASNGESAGTEGLSYRLEAIEIQLVKKGEEAPVSDETAFKTTRDLTNTYGMLYYVDGVLIVNKKHSLPSDYAPGENAVAGNAIRQLISDMRSLGYDISTSYSGYRSYDYQSYLYNYYVSAYGQAEADTFSARPGYSEHQTGLAFDLLNTSGALVESSAEVNWIAQNANKYGFIVRYQSGKESITGYRAEPWHLRYLGVDLATKVYNSGLTLEEYMGISGGSY